MNKRALPVRMEKDIYKKVEEISRIEKRSASSFCELQIEKGVLEYEQINGAIKLK